MQSIVLSALQICFYTVLGIKPRILCMIGKHSTKWAKSPAQDLVFSVNFEMQKTNRLNLENLKVLTQS